MWRGIADENAKNVGALGHIALAGAVTNGLDRHGGHGTEGMGEGLGEGGTGWGCQFEWDIGGFDWDTDEDFGGRWGWEAYQAMGNFDFAEPDGDGREDALFDLEVGDGESDTEDIGDGVEGADFVKMDSVERGAVDFGFGGGEETKNGGSDLRGVGRDAGVSEELQDRGKVSVGRFDWSGDLESTGAKVMSSGWGSGDEDLGQADCVECGLEEFAWEATIDESGQGHIPGDAG